MSELEDTLAFHMKIAELPVPEREHRFMPPRRFRFDFAWPDRMCAIEVEGGTWSGGAHTRGKHFEQDCEKYSEAAIRGWKVVRVTTDMVRDGRAVKLAGRLLEANGWLIR